MPSLCYGYSTLIFVLFCCTSSLYTQDIERDKYLKQCDKHQEMPSDCRRQNTIQDGHLESSSSPKMSSHLSREPSSSAGSTKTIATAKTRGRLGNHLWGYMNLMFVEISYGIEIVVEKEVKNSLTSFFKNLEDLRTINDVCGYNEFFLQYRDMIDALLVRKYEEMSGVKVKLTREEHTVTIDPVEVVLKYGKINAETLADSEEFIQEFKVDYSEFPTDCPYKVSNYIIMLAVS